MQSSRSHASLSPKDWINVDELTLEKQFNLLKKKKMISFDIKIHLTINETLTVSRKINYLRWIIKVINNKKKKELIKSGWLEL